MQPICFLANTVKDIMKHTHSMSTHTQGENTHLPSSHHLLHTFGSGWFLFKREDDLLGLLVLSDDGLPAGHLLTAALVRHAPLDLYTHTAIFFFLNKTH